MNEARVGRKPPEFGQPLFSFCCKTRSIVHPLGQWFSKCGARTRSISITWKLLQDADHPQTSWIRNSWGVAWQTVASGRRPPTDRREHWLALREPKMTQPDISGQVFKFHPQGASPAPGVNWAHPHLPPLSGALSDDTSDSTESTAIPAPMLCCGHTQKAPGSQAGPSFSCKSW